MGIALVEASARAGPGMFGLFHFRLCSPLFDMSPTVDVPPPLPVTPTAADPRSASPQTPVTRLAGCYIDPVFGMGD